jgi:hypothetical protein
MDRAYAGEWGVDKEARRGTGKRCGGGKTPEWCRRVTVLRFPVVNCWWSHVKSDHSDVAPGLSSFPRWAGCMHHIYCITPEHVGAKHCEDAGEGQGRSDSLGPGIPSPYREDGSAPNCMRVETGLYRRVAGLAERGEDGSSVGCEFLILFKKYCEGFIRSEKSNTSSNFYFSPLEIVAIQCEYCKWPYFVIYNSNYQRRFYLRKTQKRRQSSPSTC